MAHTPRNIKDGDGTLRQFLFDLVGGSHFSRVKILHGGEGTVTDVTPNTALPISAVDASGVPGIFVEASPDNAAYVVPAVRMAAGATGGKIAFGAASVASANTVVGTLVVVCATQPCFIRQGGAPVAAVDTDTYIPANTRSPFIVNPGSKIAAIRPTGGSDGTLYYSVIG